MQYFVLVVVIPASVAFLGTLVTCSINCIRACNEAESAIVCNQSLILISDVTNWNLEKNYAAFENMKRDCMGRESCDPSRVCGPEYRQSLVVHYLCVDARHIRPKPCNGHVLKMKGNSGYIQSPGYPETTASYVPCKWQIDPPNDTVVVLSLHDIAVSGSIENCDEGLVVAGRSCDGDSSVFVRRILCGGDNLTSLVRCGKVDIELSVDQRVYPLRFWLSFHVHSKNQASNFQASLLPCSGWIYDTNSESRHGAKASMDTESTPVPAVNGAEANTEVLIIMLSIISGISAVLLIILIVVCIRCHLLQAPHAESDSSSGLRAHYKYISSLDSEKTRPQLADGYFEVADALPFTQRGETPTSPAYADVELIAQLRKALWSSSSEHGLKGCKPSPGEGKLADSDKNSEESHLDDIGISLEAAELRLLKHEKDNSVDSERRSVIKRKNVGAKMKTPNKSKQLSLNSPSEPHNKAPGTVTSRTDNNCSTNEQPGEDSGVKFSSSSDQKSPPGIRHPQTGRQHNDLTVKNSSPENGTKTQSKVKDRGNTSTDNCNGIQHSSLLPEVTFCQASSFSKTGHLNKTSSSLCEGKKSVPSRNADASSKTSRVKSSNHNFIDQNIQQGGGVMKKGVQNFDLNGSIK